MKGYINWVWGLVISSFRQNLKNPIYLPLIFCTRTFGDIERKFVEDSTTLFLYMIRFP